MRVVARPNSHNTAVVKTTAALEVQRESVADIRSALSMKVRELIRLLQNDGWYLVQTRGSPIGNTSMLRSVVASPSLGT